MTPPVPLIVHLAYHANENKHLEGRCAGNKWKKVAE